LAEANNELFEARSIIIAGDDGYELRSDDPIEQVYSQEEFINIKYNGDSETEPLSIESSVNVIVDLGSLVMRTNNGKLLNVKLFLTQKMKSRMDQRQKQM